MISKHDIFQLLESQGVRHDDVVTIHASLRAPGPIEGGADGLIDALTEYLQDGLLLVPTHTWAVVNRANPFFDVRSTIPNIGTLARVAAFRPDALPSPDALAGCVRTQRPRVRTGRGAFCNPRAHGRLSEPPV